MGRRPAIAAAALVFLLAPRVSAALVAGHLALDHHEGPAAPQAPLAPAWHGHDRAPDSHDHALSPGVERAAELRRAAPVAPPDGALRALAPEAPAHAVSAAAGCAALDPDPPPPRPPLVRRI